MSWPISIDDVVAARERLAPHLAPTPLRSYPPLDALIGHEVRAAVKHENHQPTNAFKIRNGLSFMTALTPDERSRGVVAASTGNHGQGVAYGAALVGTSATICVPVGNNPEKNAAMRALGATVLEEGRDYDEALIAMHRVAANGGFVIAHSTNDPRIIAGAGTITLELLEQDPGIEAIVVAVGGGSQAVGALTVTRARAPHVAVYGVQSAQAPAIHDAWHGGPRGTSTTAPGTFADGIATRSTYELTFPALQEGLADFITVTDAEIAEAMRIAIGTTHTLVEGAGAAGLAGLLKLRERLAGKRVAVILSGGNVSTEVLRRVLTREL